MQEYPNIIIIQTDQQALWSITAYQKQNFLETPHIDSLAFEGSLNTRFYTNANPCTPSRGCFLTGAYPFQHGAIFNNVEINQSSHTFAKILRDNHQYTTAYIGKYHLDGTAKPGWVHKTRNMGFQDNQYMFNRGHFKKIKNFSSSELDHPNVYAEIGDEKHYTTDWLTRKAIKWIKNHYENPFLLMLSIPDPHNPYKTREPYQSLFKPEDIQLPPTFNQNPEELPPWINKKKFLVQSEHRMKEIKASYCGMISLIDKNVGDLIRELKSLEIYDNTIVIFTSDHGDYMGEHGLISKNGMYPSVYNIPMILRYPKKIEAKSINNQLWSTVDFAPTLLGLLGLNDYDNGLFEGKDYSSDIIKSNSINSDRYIFIEDQSINPYQKGEIGICSEQYWYATNEKNEEIFFDLSRDPEHKYNLIDIDHHKENILELRGKLYKHHLKIQSPQSNWFKDFESMS